MKKTMKLTYLLTLLLLLFTFTACGDKEEKTTEKEDAKVEDTKDKDTENDTENTEDASSSEEESTQSGDAENDDTTTSDGSATLSDISFTVNKEWTLDSSSVEGSSLMYLIPSDGDFNNNFIVQVTDVGTEQTDEDLQVSADEIIKAYEYIGATLVEESTFDTACGTARIFTFDATKMYETSEVTGCTTYMKRAIFVNGTKTYTVELTCLSDDFDALSKEMDNVLSSITLK